jgi:hypothetical protein
VKALRQIREVYPDAKFIWIHRYDPKKKKKKKHTHTPAHNSIKILVRDPKDVTSSYTAFMGAISARIFESKVAAFYKNINLIFVNN